MKKFKGKVLAFLLMLIIVSTSCATILGGRVTECQKTKPLPGQPQREVRIGYLILDIFTLGPVWVIVDVMTGAIYKPCK